MSKLDEIKARLAASKATIPSSVPQTGKSNELETVNQNSIGTSAPATGDSGDANRISDGSSGQLVRHGTEEVGQLGSEVIVASTQVIPGTAKLVRESALPVDFLNKVLDLEQALLDRHPRMPLLLKDIHKTLASQPENVTLMNEDEIAIVCNGLKIQTGVEFAAATVKGSSSQTKSLAKKIATLGADAF